MRLIDRCARTMIKWFGSLVIAMVLWGVALVALIALMTGAWP